MQSAPPSGEPHHGVAQAPALRAFLDDLRVDAVAGVTDSAFGAASRDAGVGASAAGAGRQPRPRVAGAADPALGPKLPKIGDGRAAVCAAGPDHRVSGVVQDVGQPQQDRRAAGITGGQRIRVGVHVPGQLLKEPRRTAHRDRHRRLQRRLRGVCVQSRDSGGQAA